MPLLLFDLDNTLIDRDGAFLAWAEDFLTANGLPRSELSWLTTIDGGGFIPRETVFRAAVSRYGLAGPLDERLAVLSGDYKAAVLKRVQLPEENRTALVAARAAGWTLGIVTNGETAHQSAKITATGLDELVDAYVVSEEAGHEKPDPEIFRVAADRCGMAPAASAGSSDPLVSSDIPETVGAATGPGAPTSRASRLPSEPLDALSSALDSTLDSTLDSSVGFAAEDWRQQTWMIGDHPPADIAGAHVAGLRSVWLHHRRPWPHLHFRPTLTAGGLPEAVALVLSAEARPGA